MKLTIDSLAHGGDGVARAEDGRAVFVTGACPGDVVSAVVTEEHDRYLRATVVEVLEPSPERRRPPCPYFGECGGCQWQHVSHAAQVVAKRQAVIDALTRIGGVTQPLVEEVLTGGHAYGYRNKVELTVGEDARGGLVLGLSAIGTQRLVPVESCLLLPEKRRAYPKALAGALRFLSRGGPLGLSRVAIRSAARTGDVEVDLWAAPGPFARAAAVRTLSSAVRFETLTRVLARGDVKSRDVSNVEVLAGQGYLRERMNGFEYRVSAPSFFQVNTPVAESMTALVLAELAPDGSDRVLDVYAGVGTFTLPLADLAGEVVALESYGPAVRDLRRNIDHAGVDVDLAPGDAARALPDVGSADLAVVDPPRSGLTDAAAAAIAGCGPRRIVYVSCDPATLARDVARLRTHGYSFVRATPVDLFPQTYHTETVAVLDRDRS
ncbi:MAG: 23S rRNA (uracil(1939)-C(5))-methyltransferase RlmD [Coriobacteriia bacterium]|nr:23S rRNA (uracil(1939)-C(5))-methyltransferase RlmD [Coriobacteriia bacterium]